MVPHKAEQQSGSRAMKWEVTLPNCYCFPKRITVTSPGWWKFRLAVERRYQMAAVKREHENSQADLIIEI